MGESLMARLLRLRLRITLGAAVVMSATLVFAIGDSPREAATLKMTGKLDSYQSDAALSILTPQVVEAVDIAAIKNRLETEDWIYAANVAFEWPATVHVHVVPETPIAYWNEAEYINQDGKIFSSAKVIGGNLPQLNGPLGTEKELMNHYQTLSRMLIESGQVIAEITMNERGGITFQTVAGVEVMLGKVDIKTRLQRYLRVMQQVEEGQVVARADARYSQGVAVLMEQSAPQVSKIDEEKSLKREKL